MLTTLASAIKGYMADHLRQECHSRRARLVHADKPLALHYRFHSS